MVVDAGYTGLHDPDLPPALPGEIEVTEVPSPDEHEHEVWIGCDAGGEPHIWQGTGRYPNALGRLGPHSEIFFYEEIEWTDLPKIHAAIERWLSVRGRG